MTRYARNTSVGNDRSRAEIERALSRYRAEGFMYGWNADQAVVGFSAFGRQVKFHLPRQLRERVHAAAPAGSGRMNLHQAIRTIQSDILGLKYREWAWLEIDTTDLMSRPELIRRLETA